MTPRAGGRSHATLTAPGRRLGGLVLATVLLASAVGGPVAASPVPGSALDPDPAPAPALVSALDPDDDGPVATSAGGHDGARDGAAAVSVGDVASPADELAFAYTFERVPDRPGAVRIHVETTAPDRVSSVTVRPPTGATVETATGYVEAGTDEDGRTEWTWDRSSDGSGVSTATDHQSTRRTATISYVADVNRTDGDDLAGTSTGEWALFNWRTVDLQWAYERPRSTAEPTVTERAVGAAGEGIVGPGYAYLGPAETYERTVEGERLRLVVPEAATDGMDESPGAVLSTLATASRELDVGGRNERVTVFVAPAPIEAPGRLSRAGPADRDDAYVRADQPLDTPDNAWVHEYVHARQDYRTTEALAWLDDGLAEYYAALLTYEQGRISEAAFYEYVRTNASADATLSETAVGDPATYEKGRRVAAALDAVVRADSDGLQTLQDVLARLNAAEGRLDAKTLQDGVAGAAGSAHDEWVTRYTTTPATPPVPATLDPPVNDDGDVAGRIGAAPPLGHVLFALGAGLTALAAVSVRRRR